MRSAAAVLAVLLSACSPANVGGISDAGVHDATPDVGGTTDGATSIDDACNDFAHDRCTQFEACSPVVIQLRFGTLATCKAVFKAECTAQLEASGTGLTPAVEEECASALMTWDCPDYLMDSNPPPACAAHLGGNANGGPCGLSVQCQSGFCAIVPGATCGQCTDPPATGDSCADLTTCGVGSVCVNAVQKCQPNVAMGQMCGYSILCATGLQCVGASGTNNEGTCQPQATTLGQSCSGTGGCNNLDGIACNPLSGTCQLLQIASQGQSCGIVNRQLANCGSAGTCSSISTTAPGVCTVASSLGGPCDLAKGPGCIAPGRCLVGDGGTGGTCQIPSTASCQ